MLDARIQVHLFGALSLFHNGEQIHLPRSVSARALLVYLLLNRKISQPRLKLIGVLWPETPEGQARRALTQALWHLRRDLPEGLLETNADHIQISPQASLWVDAEIFASLAKKNLKAAQCDTKNLRQAVDLYRGDLLEGFYDDWVLVEREHLRELYLRSLDFLVDTEKTAGHYAQALDYAQRLTRADSFRESAHRAVMRLHYALNQTDAALNQYALCCKILEDELGVEPDEETKALAHEIAVRATQKGSPYLPPVITPPGIPWQQDDVQSIQIPILGRDEERECLLRHLESSMNATGGTVLVEGSSGVGKTRLLEAFARDAEWRGAEVLWGHSSESGTATPYEVIVNALSSGLTSLRVNQLAYTVDEIWLSALGTIIPNLTDKLQNLPKLPDMAPEQSHERLMSAFAITLSAWGQIRPLVFILEDIHWADEDSLDLLIAQARHITGQHILVIGSYRGAEARGNPAVWQKLDALDRAGVRQRMVLDNLNADSSGELVRRALGLTKAAPLFEERLFQETGGNPLFLLETLRTLHDEGLLIQDENGKWSTSWDATTENYAELPISPAVERTIARRVKLLPDSLQPILQLAAVLGKRFHFDELHKTSGGQLHDLLTKIRPLIQHNFLEETAQGYRFSHEKIHQVVYEEIDDKRRTILHLQVAQTLSNLSPERFADLAWHYQGAGDIDKATNYYFRAGQSSMAVSAFTGALEFFDQALALIEIEPGSMTTEEHFAILASRAEVLRILGRRDDQAKDLDTMKQLSQDSPDLTLKTLLLMAWLQTQTGDYDKAEANTEKAQALAANLGNQLQETEALIIAGTIRNWRGQPKDAIPLLENAVNLATRYDDFDMMAQARHALANALLGIKDYQRAQAEIERALEIYTRQGNVMGQLDQVHISGIAYMEQGDFDTASKLYQRSIELSQGLGYLYAEGRAQINLANIRFLQGNITAALDGYAQAADNFQLTGNRRGEAMTRANLASLKTSILGDLKGARREVDAALAAFRDMGDSVGEGQCLVVSGEVYRSQGNYAQAIPSMESGIEKLLAGGEKWIAAQCFRLLILVFIDNNQPELAIETAERAEQICNELGNDDMLMYCNALHGIAHLHVDQPEKALQITERAITNWRKDIDQSYLFPYWHYQCLIANQRIPEAHQALTQAHQLLMEILQGLSSEQQKYSLENVPEHRGIMTAWGEIQPQRISISLPQIGAPTGRPLQSDEYVEVTWTVEALEDGEIEGKTDRRRHRILRLLAEADVQGAAPTVGDLAAILKVSDRTIKRDIAILRQVGHHIETRGSA